jgi:hypothetical protein
MINEVMFVGEAHSDSEEPLRVFVTSWFKLFSNCVRNFTPLMAKRNRRCGKSVGRDGGGLARKLAMAMGVLHALASGCKELIGGIAGRLFHICGTGAKRRSGNSCAAIALGPIGELLRKMSANGAIRFES